MKKVLIIASGYCGKATANGLCAQAICEELSCNNISCKVITYGDEDIAFDKDSNISYILHKKKEKQSNWFLRFLALLKRFICNTFSPQYDKKLVNKIYKEALKLYSIEKYDAIISMYFPIEAVLAGYKLKKKLQRVKCLIYELDSVGDGLGGGKSLSEKHLVFSYTFLLNKLYKKADGIMVLNCHKLYWEEKYKPFLQKLEIVDLPLLKNKKAPYCKENKEISFIYSGVLNENYRSPIKMVETFSSFDFSYKLNFYSKGCESYLKENQKENKKININGYVEKEVLEKAILNADFLINIGNSKSNSLPSKLITYMSYCKPIIHFSLQENDICEKYLSHYPAAFIVSDKQTLEEYKEKLILFINENIEKNIEFQDFVKSFEMNVPFYSTQKIIEKLNGVD